ncbi:MAG: HAD family hydrolase [Sulfuricellaceae bacterium]
MAILKALIFDVDGTLAETERDGHRVAFNAAFREFGLDWEWNAALYGKLLAVSGGKERIRYYLDRFRRDFAQPSDLDALIKSLHQAKTRHYVELLERGGIPLRPGVKRLITEARNAGLRLAIATTTAPDNVAALLRCSLAPDAESWFEVIAAGDIVPAKKPAPDIFLWALDKLKLAPGDCLAFEDSENGLKSSLGAGLKTVVTVSDYTVDQDFSGAAAVLSDLGEPAQPFKLLAGELQGEGWVTVELLMRDGKHS